MKYTDRFFRVPIKVYDELEITAALLKEDKQLENDPELVKIEEASWVQCWYEILPDDIIGYSENFSREVGDITSALPDLTLISTKHQGQLPCLWKINKFKDKLNEFYQQFSNNSINSERS